MRNEKQDFLKRGPLHSLISLKNPMNIQCIVMAILLFFMVPRAQAQTYTCTGEITAPSNATINVGANQTVCLTSTSGAYTPSLITIATTGILVIKAGATLNYTQWPTNLGGKIINLGVLNLNGNLESANLENYGTITVNQMQQNTNSNQIAIKNNGKITINSTWNLNDAIINNRDSFLLNTNGGFKGFLENTGYMNFKDGINNQTALAATIKNYGYIAISGALGIKSSTYMTNDSIIKISNVGVVNFDGQMFTNNGKFWVTNGNLQINSTQTQFANNGIILVSGDFGMKQSGTDTAKVQNACRIVANNITLNEGVKLTNSGLLWAFNKIDIQGNPGTTYLYNESSGFVRGADYGNSGSIRGFGQFYFSGTNIINNNGSITGDSFSNPVRFYTPSGTLTGGTFTNVSFLTSSSITPLDTTDFDCSGISPVVAGNPPHVKDTIVNLCSIPSSITFNVVADNLITPFDNTYTIIWSSLVLLPYGGNSPTTTLTMPQGTFVADTANRTIVFTPVLPFTGSMAKVQFRADNTKPGSLISTSLRGTITVNINPVSPPILDSSSVSGY